MIRRSLLVILVVSTWAMLISGCGAKNDMSDLSANPWVVTRVASSGELTKVLEGTSPTIFFRSDGAAVGNASVNTFQADYDITGREIQIGSIIASQWEGPQQEMAQEQVVFAALESAQRYAVAQGELVLYAASGEPVMRLDVAPEPQLVGPLWLCTDCVGEDGQLLPVVGTNPVGAEFAPSGELGGTGGVTTYTTTYVLNGSQMTVGPEIVTDENSGSADMEAQEARYYESLKRTASYKIEEYQLILSDAEGTPLVVFIPWAPKQ